MYDEYMGVIKALGFQFVPADWGYCGGTLIGINQYSTLFSLLGCQYGGDCRTSFALPDLRGRTPMGQGTGPGLTPRFMGQMPGYQQTVLNSLEMPAHSHAHTYTGGGGGAASVDVRVAAAGGKSQLPDAGDYIAAPGNALGIPQDNLFLAPSDVTTTEVVGGVSATGGGGFNNSLLTIQSSPQPTQYVPLTQPSLAVNYCICMEGLYPSRS